MIGILLSVITLAYMGILIAQGIIADSRYRPQTGSQISTQSKDYLSYYPKLPDRLQAVAEDMSILYTYSKQNGLWFFQLSKGSVEYSVYEKNSLADVHDGYNDFRQKLTNNSYFLQENGEIENNTDVYRSSVYENTSDNMYFLMEYEQYLVIIYCPNQAERSQVEQWLLWMFNEKYFLS